MPLKLHVGTRDATPSRYPTKTCTLRSPKHTSVNVHGPKLGTTPLPVNNTADE